MKRAIIVVLDSVGVGALPDAHLYGDEGSNTLGNVARAVGGLKMPNAQSLGLGNIIEIEGVPSTEKPKAAWGKMGEMSVGKDTTTGHWELAGLVLETPFPTYPEGFPPEVMDEFERRIGRKTLGNFPASGTVIIEQLGGEHIRTGYPIVYTSADSVFQIAAHEEVVPLDTLYEWCSIARDMLQGKHGVGRVIARPFVGEIGSFTRTANRRDYSLEPIKPTVLDALIGAGVPVYGVGKIKDIFAGRGVSDSFPTKNNAMGVDETVRLMQEKREECLIFANLVDFDMLWGHRNDPESYAKGLEEFDLRLPEILAELGEDDLLLIVADHGCDPTTPSTDHSREYVPLLAVGSKVRPVNLGVRRTFADVAATIAHFFAVDYKTVGESFLKQITESR
ncbi:MAG: phosphopentomutase [Firmicutes bacterium]|jgi:phosphopentomutase|nr:phosphopentomutase [Bacillota bacterium]NLO65938.1 phosphopentomutase [Bacillota bacterium]